MCVHRAGVLGRDSRWHILLRSRVRLKINHWRSSPGLQSSRVSTSTPVSFYTAVTHSLLGHIANGECVRTPTDLSKWRATQKLSHHCSMRSFVSHCPLCLAALAHCTALAPPKRVLVVGGSGRVGASTVRWIDKLAKAEQVPVELAIGGRRQASFDAAAKRLGAKGVDELKFVQLDLDDAASLERAVAGRSLVVHTAGPFQQRTDPTLLKACIDAGVRTATSATSSS